MKRGNSIPASLEHVVYYPTKPADKYPAIIALHGRGTDEHDLAPLVFSLGLDGALVISPRAPRPFQFGGGFAWYDLGEEGVPEAETFRASLDLLRRFIVEVKAGYSLDRTILLGFSQGTVMAYAAALLDPDSFRGVAALSGYIPQHSGLTFRLDRLGGLSVFISHGSFDEVIPLQLGRESAELLKGSGARVEYHEYPMGHEVRQETLRDLSAWTKDMFEKHV